MYQVLLSCYAIPSDGLQVLCWAMQPPYAIQLVKSSSSPPEPVDEDHIENRQVQLLRKLLRSHLAGGDFSHRLALMTSALQQLTQVLTLADSTRSSNWKDYIDGFKITSPQIRYIAPPSSSWHMRPELTYWLNAP